MVPAATKYIFAVLRLYHNGLSSPACSGTYSLVDGHIRFPARQGNVSIGLKIIIIADIYILLDNSQHLIKTYILIKRQIAQFSEALCATVLRMKKDTVSWRARF